MPSPEFLRTGSNPRVHARVGKQQVMNWRFSTFAFGSVVLGVVLIGALAASHREDVPVKSPVTTVTVLLPAVGPSSDSVAVPAQTKVDQPAFVSPKVIERARQRIRARAALARLRSGSAHERHRRAAAAATDQRPTDLTAKLPLPNSVIARTIERIGYPCGAVASATALEGDGPGVYRVTCTSGQSYRAEPVHGRYHFRRL